MPKKEAFWNNDGIEDGIPILREKEATGEALLPGEIIQKAQTLKEKELEAEMEAEAGAIRKAIFDDGDEFGQAEIAD